MNGVGYDDAMPEMRDKVLNSDMLDTYLMMTNIGSNVVRVTVVHSIVRYSARFGGSNALHGHTLVLLGKTVGTQLPMLAQFLADSTGDLIHALGMEEVTVPLDAQ
jgi:hypothetical protein